MGDAHANLLRGTLELLILKALNWGPRHGYGVAEWIETATDDTLLIEEGTLYPALHRLEAKGLIDADWGVSANNRRAKYYHLTTGGKRQLRSETTVWNRYANAVGKALAMTAGGPG